MFDEENKKPNDNELLDFPIHFDEVIKKFITLCVPVHVTPKVKIGKVKTERCGDPIITAKKHGICDDKKCDDGCHFNIVQKMKIEIPIDFDAHTKVDESFVDCELKDEKEL